MLPRTLARWATLSLALTGCNWVNSTVNSVAGGSCHGTQSVASIRVDVCTEPAASPPGVETIATLNGVCRAGTLGATANDWHMGQACGTTNRIGGCRRAVSGIDVVTWFYAPDGGFPSIPIDAALPPDAGITVDASIPGPQDLVRTACSGIGGTFQAP